MKKIKLLIIPVAALLLCGCDEKPIEEVKSEQYEYYMQGSEKFKFYVDKQTCVEYIEFSSGYSKHITPRLNADGTLIINEICINELKKGN